MLHSLFGVPHYLISFLITLSVVVFVHELGHFLLARRNGVRCESFSIGLGPELFGRTDRHGTRWKISLIPIGGYVKMFGEFETMQIVEGGSEAGERPLTPQEKAVSFQYKTVAQRAAIVFAGPAVNFLFAIIVYFAVFLIHGRPIVEPVVGKVVPNSAAADAGLHPGDRIVDIDGHKIARFDDIARLVLLDDGTPMRVTVARDGGTRVFSITPRIVEQPDALGNVEKTPLLGISQSIDAGNIEHLGVAGALNAACEQTWDIVDSTRVVIGQMLTGRRGTQDLGGPIRIAKYSGEASEQGVTTFVLFVAFLSINLGLVNLLPVPMLDGGHLLFYAIEAMRGRPLSDRAQEWGLRVGAALVLALMVFGFCNDIAQL